MSIFPHDTVPIPLPLLDLYLILAPLQEREEDIAYWGKLLEATTAKLTAHQLSKEAALMDR